MMTLRGGASSAWSGTTLRVLAGGLAVTGVAAVALAVLLVEGPVTAPAVAGTGGLALGLGAAELCLARRPPRPADGEALPAVVAHRMTSPLASLRSNLGWLRDALEAGRLREPREAEEARQAVAGLAERRLIRLPSARRPKVLGRGAPRVAARRSAGHRVRIGVSHSAPLSLADRRGSWRAVP
jgi:hypothetical protein